MLEVAAYCRVSTDREDQASSFENQRRFFQEYIESHPDWRLFCIYADEGVTGTSTKKREAFNRMIGDARRRAFQLILTKEVSRFSRNILDAIAYTRELRGLGIGVLFLNDGINTLDPDAELRLSIMGSLAQEESRRTSSRVKWGQTRRMEQGVVFGRSLLGYDVRNGQMTINPEGAEVVRRIFHMYGVEKKGTTTIAQALEAEGIRTRSGGVKWSNSHIVKLLKNEKYAGDLVQKKTITPDYLSHAKKYNHGEEPLVILRNHHPPIVDRALWDFVQKELRRRTRKRGEGRGSSSDYALSGKLVCGQCGASLVARKRLRSDGSFYRRWSCRTAVTKGRAGCALGWSLREESALILLQQSLDTLDLDHEALLQNVTDCAVAAIQQEGVERAGELEHASKKLRQKRADALDAFFSKRITEEDLALLKRRYDRELDALEKRLEAAERAKAAAPGNLRWDIYDKLTSIWNDGVTGEILCRSILEEMTIYQDRRVVVRLRHLPGSWTYFLGSS